MSKRKELLEWLKHEPDLVYPKHHLHDAGVWLEAATVGTQLTEFCLALRHSGTWVPPYSIDRLNKSLDQLRERFDMEPIAEFEMRAGELCYGMLRTQETIETSVGGLRACGIEVALNDFRVDPRRQITVDRTIIVNVLPCKLLLQRHTQNEFPQAMLDNPTMWDKVMLSTIR